MRSGSDSEADLLTALLARRGIVRPAGTTIPRREDRSRAPLSFSQQRLWFLDHLMPGNPAYHVPVYFRLSGPLSRPALEFAFNAVIERHEVLRARLVDAGMGPEQRIAPAIPVVPRTFDLTGWPADTRESRIAEILAAENGAPFDLARGPLFRLAVIAVRADEHVVACTLHHIVFDGGSVDVLIREIGAAYHAHLGRLPLALPPLPVQYADFAAWQRARLTGDLLERQLAYWRERLADAPVLSLPVDRPRPAVQTFAGASEPFALDAALSTALRRFASASSATVFMVLGAAFRLAMARETGQRDLVIGSPIANRSPRELEPLIGFFVNTMALRSQLDTRSSFRELVARERHVVSGALEHQDVPFDKLVDVLRPDRDLSQHPLVQVTFSVDPAPAEPLTLPGLTLAPLAPPVATTKFDLTVSLAAGPDGIVGSAQYNPDVYLRQTARAWMDRFAQLLACVMADPDRPIRELPLLEPGEVARLMEHGRAPGDARIDPATVIDRVNRTAMVYPEAAAIVAGSHTVTYRQLDERATRLAEELRACGAGPERVVALCLDRSIEYVIALVAALKTGGAYLPLDPAHPPDHLGALIREVRPVAVVTSSVLAARLGGCTASLIVCAERGEAVVRLGADVARSVAAAVWPPARLAPEMLAYVVYTSGSTGAPNGVMVSHASLSHLVAWHQRAFAVTREDRATLVAGVGFDASVWEVWPYLTLGASLHIPDRDTLLDPVQLCRWAADQRISIAFFPTPLAESLLPLEWRQSTLRALLTGGDVLHASPPAGLPFRVFNNYGPTECTVVATSCALTTAGDAGVAPSIGRPIDATEVYLVDPDLNLVPLGAPGEVLLGGAGVARGYLAQPGLTAARFVPDPFSAEPGRRLYRTGDLARWRLDGRLEFVGRIDRQLKIRGFRIEPAGLERVLRQFDGVVDAAVVAIDRENGRRLMAFIVVQPQARLDVDAVRRRLAAQLPAHMVPADIIPLDRLPLTPNGKIDRRALTLVELPGRETDSAAATDTERAVAAVWCDVLERPHVGVTSNFFDVGGHSLLLILLQQRLQAMTSRDLPIVDLFANPTVRGLAAYLDAGGGAGPLRLDATRERVARQREASERRREARSR